MPVIRTQDRIAQLTDGDILVVTCTDPGVRHDIPAWCRVHGHRVTNTVSREGEIVVTIKVQK